jgi:hypothetical protein
VDPPPGHPYLAADLLSGLERLGQQWQRLGAPIASYLRPGLSARDIDALAEAHGLTIPPELRVWWAWHDGAARPAEVPLYSASIGPGSLTFLGLRESLDAAASNRSIHAKSEGLGDLYWRDAWLPILICDATRVYVDCPRVTPEGYSPLRVVVWEWAGYSVDRAPSLTAAVHMWAQLLEDDHYRIVSHPSGGWPMWECDYDGLPMEARKSGLV